MAKRKPPDSLDEPLDLLEDRDESVGPVVPDPPEPDPSEFEPLEIVSGNWEPDEEDSEEEGEGSPFADLDDGTFGLPGESVGDEDSEDFEDAFTEEEPWEHEDEAGRLMSTDELDDPFRDESGPDGLTGGEEEQVGTIGPDDWAELEDEGQSLAPGRVLVGLKEFVSFPDLACTDLVACFDTGEPRSLMVVPVTAVAPGKVRIGLADREHVVRAREEDGYLSLKLRMGLGGVSRTVAFRVIAGGSDEEIVLGRDAIEGYFVIDPALRFIHQRSGDLAPLSPSSGS